MESLVTISSIKTFKCRTNKGPHLSVNVYAKLHSGVEILPPEKFSLVHRNSPLPDLGDYMVTIEPGTNPRAHRVITSFAPVEGVWND